MSTTTEKADQAIADADPILAAQLGILSAEEWDAELAKEKAEREAAEAAARQEMAKEEEARERSEANPHGFEVRYTVTMPRVFNSTTGAMCASGYTACSSGAAYPYPKEK